MKNESVFEFLKDKKLIIAAIIILLTVVIYKILKKIINRAIQRIDNSHGKNSKRRKTYLKLFNNSIKYIFIIIDAILILQTYGIDVSSIVAGLGVVSIVIGLALQDALKDIIAGCNIMLDGYFSIGDVIKIDDVEGKIIEIKLKVTKLRDINNQNVFVVANRNIVKALNLSTQLDIDIPIPYEEDIKKIEIILDDIIQTAKETENIEDIKYVGIDQFGESAILYKLRLWCLPELKPQIKRDTLRLIKMKLDENDVSIPYNQIDLHQK